MILFFHIELEPEITIAAKTLESCLELLIPPPEAFSIPEAEEAARDVPSTSSGISTESSSQVDSDDENDDVKRRETGIIDAAAQSVTVTLRPGDYYC